jgi:hypothetical protein
MSLDSSCVYLAIAVLSEKEGIMSFGISISIAAAAMEGIYERLCCIYITGKNTLVYDHVGNTYHLSELSANRHHCHCLISFVTSRSARAQVF